MEQVFFRLHVRCVSSTTKILGPKSRKFLEYTLLVHAIAGLALLMHIHMNFISTSSADCCLKKYIDIPNNTQMINIKILSMRSNFQQHHAIDSESVRDPIESGNSGLTSLSIEIESLATNLWHCAFNKSYILRAVIFLSSFYGNHLQQLPLRYHQKTYDVEYLFAFEKGYIILHNELQSKKNDIQATNITIPNNSDCFGTPWLALLIENFIGYDTILMNDLIRYFGGHGYLYNLQSKQLFNLNYAAEFTASTTSFFSYVLFKIGILFTTLFLFFTTTTLVSFTLRQTQKRMLKFTFLLQYHIRNQIPYARLVLTHVVESIVFVPIMVGMLFFLFEFFNDQLLAFMMLSVVWLCELFSVVSVRTRISICSFPRIFFWYFSLFHVYFFSFPFGFSYLALFTTVLFLQHAMLYFWNRYEIPAVEQGHVSFTIPRQLTLTQHSVPTDNRDGATDRDLPRSESSESLESELSNNDNFASEDQIEIENSLFSHRNVDQLGGYSGRRRAFYFNDIE